MSFKISELPDAGAIQEEDLVPVVQNGTTRKITTDKLAKPGRSISVTTTGTLKVMTGVARYYPQRAITLDNLSAFVGEAPQGANLIFDLLKNGTVITTGTVIDGQFKAAEIGGLAISLTPADYLTMDITQVGASIPGAELRVRISY